MDETVRTLSDLLHFLKSESAIEYVKPVRAGNQASMCLNIVRDITAELIRLEEECERLEKWRGNVDKSIIPENFRG